MLMNLLLSVPQKHVYIPEQRVYILIKFYVRLKTPGSSSTQAVVSSHCNSVSLSSAIITRCHAAGPPDPLMLAHRFRFILPLSVQSRFARLFTGDLATRQRSKQWSLAKKYPTTHRTSHNLRCQGQT